MSAAAAAAAAKAEAALESMEFNTPPPLINVTVGNKKYNVQVTPKGTQGGGGRRHNKRKATRHNKRKGTRRNKRKGTRRNKRRGTRRNKRN